MIVKSILYALLLTCLWHYLPWLTIFLLAFAVSVLLEGMTRYLSAEKEMLQSQMDRLDPTP